MAIWAFSYNTCPGQSLKGEGAFALGVGGGQGKDGFK
jgi:hypothetical protein